MPTNKKINFWREVTLPNPTIPDSIYFISDSDDRFEIFITDSENDVRSLYHPASSGSGTYDLTETFETISKNIKSFDCTFNYTSDDLTSIDYNTITGVITKTFNYTLGELSSIVLSGILPQNINLSKIFTYNTNGDLININYT